MNKQNLHTEIIALCDYASVSQEGKLSINGIFDELRVQKFPGGIARAFFVATIAGTPNTAYKLNLKLENKNNGATLSNTSIETMTAPNGKNNLLIELVGLAFEKEGDFQFKIYHDGKEAGVTQLKVFHHTGKIINKEERMPN
ncbi:MAG: hypothetical protein COU25_03440 [Candidatus Levybacteria bacterium CG10_big_fil_rev_8_21_14_0_10_35_13]|nr:MAG: hypothetical protein COU25_03440 [Candidatus Levybacteria bacterium CG10_big_fil_rev_8_21_14_0_10_35_13]